MAKNFANIRLEKRYSPKEINGIWKENIRKVDVSNVDANRSHLNITVSPLLFENYDDFVVTRREQIRIANKQRKSNERKARMPGITKNQKTGKEKYRAMMQEFVFTHTPGALSEDESIRYCKLAHEFIKNWFDECNIILAIIHLDETTPHIHLWTDYFNKFDNRFFQSVLQDKGKTDINEIRNAWQKKLEEEGFTLFKQDGSVVGSEHDGSKADKNKGDLKKQIVELTEIVKSLQKSILVLKNENDILKKDKSALIAGNKEKDVHGNEYIELLNTLNHYKKILRPWQKYLKGMYDLDISKEMPSVESLKPRIESTLQNKKVSKNPDTTIPSLL